jgi:ectoine hydroxylase-related dioxygenase (phytanoyl-CoA dioxygenase family)
MPLPAQFPPIDFTRFHRERLPALIATGRGTLAGPVAAHLDALAIRIAGDAFTYRPRAGSLEIVEGDADAETVVELDLEAWQGLVHELEAPAGLLYAGRVRCPRGNAVQLMSWETPLRVLYHGREPYDPTRVALPDAERSFTLDDDREAMARFLEAAGYLFVRSVFSAAEVAAFRDEADALRAEARKGDKLSWWGKNGAGEEVLCRVTRAATRPRLASLRDEPRLSTLKDLAAERLVYSRGEGDGVAVIFKHPGMAEGLGDLPWHRDCGMGGHAVMCPTAVASVFLTEASPETGELAFLPGSRHAAFNAHDPHCRGRLRAARFRAKPGDVTLHYGDTIHAAPPPTDPSRAGYRVSAIVGYARPDATPHRGGRSYNEALHRRDDGQVEHLVDVAGRVGR